MKEMVFIRKWMAMEMIEVRLEERQIENISNGGGSKTIYNIAIDHKRTRK